MIETNRDLVMPDAPPLRRLAIDDGDFFLAFDPWLDTLDLRSDTPYLDLETGDVFWVFDDDEVAAEIANMAPEENRALRKRIVAAPDRYLYVEPLDHGDHHDILRSFLRSNWTDDEEAWQYAADAYTGSIGGWKRRVDEEVVHAYNAFHDQAVRNLAEDFLMRHGIEPDWR